MNDSDKIRHLEGQVSELTGRLDTLISALGAGRSDEAIPAIPSPLAIESPSVATATVDAQPAASRRGLLKLAGAAAVGAAASVATGALPAAATNGINITDPTAFVRNDYTGANQGAAFLFQSGTSYANSAASYPAALAGWVGSGATDLIPNGVYGYTDKAGYGVVGVASTSGVGVLGYGGKANLHLLPAGTSGPSRLVSYTVGHLINDSAGNLWLCVVGGTPGTWRKIAGPATSGALHLLATPKRVYDSRVGETPATTPKTPLTSATRTIDCTLNASGVPATATGLVLNLTAISLTASGYLAVSPGGAGFSGTSTLNWTTTGAVVANGATVGATVGAGSGATVDITVGGGSANFIVDVFGYYS